MFTLQYVPLVDTTPIVSSAVPPWIEIAASFGTALTGAIAVFLLWQGLRDRRKIREDERRKQATLVTAYIENYWQDAEHGGKTLEWVAAHIRNSSDLPVVLHESLQAVRAAAWTDPSCLRPDGYRELPNQEVLLGPRLLNPKQERIVHLPSDRWTDFVIVSFTDASGMEWRRKSDSGELGPPHSRGFGVGAARALQGKIRHIKPLEALHSRMYAASFTRAMRKPAGLPLSLRLLLNLWGHDPVEGAPDPWLKPSDAPDEWHHEKLVKERHFLHSEVASDSGT